jgi:hypothetical protein
MKTNVRVVYLLITISLLTLLCVLPARALRRPDFLDAVQRGEITPVIRGSSDMGLNQGRAVEISATNNTPEPIETTVRKGTVLEARDPETQDMVVAEDLVMRIGPSGALDPPLEVFCIEIDKHPPVTTDYYTPSHMASGNLLRVIDYIDMNRLHGETAAQFAVWAVTNGVSAGDIARRSWAAFDVVMDDDAFARDAAHAQQILSGCGIQAVFHQPGTDYSTEVAQGYARYGILIAVVILVVAIILLVLLARFVRRRA